jgi:ParB/RepB/Spo0J family partition protein
MTDTLFAEGKLHFTEMSVRVDELPAQFLGRPPSDAMIDSVKRLGVLQPILVIAQPSGTMKVAAGRRRVAAARKAGLTEVPARMVQVTGGWMDEAEVLTFAENHYRADNPAAEAVAIRDLLQRGHSPAVIIEQLGMSEREFRPIAELMALDDAIFAGFTQGAVKAGVARRIAKLPLAVQKQLAIRLAEAGRLKHSDVDVTATPATATPQLGKWQEITPEIHAAVLRYTSVSDLLRAARARTRSETTRFVIDRAIKMADEDGDGGEITVPLGDTESDQPLQSSGIELAANGEDRHELVAASTEPA